MSRGFKMANLSPQECQRQSSCPGMTTFSASFTTSPSCPQPRMSMTARWSTGVWRSLFSSTGVRTILQSPVFYGFLLWRMCLALWGHKSPNCFITAAPIPVPGLPLLSFPHLKSVISLIRHPVFLLFSWWKNILLTKYPIFGPKCCSLPHALFLYSDLFFPRVWSSNPPHRDHRERSVCPGPGCGSGGHHCWDDLHHQGCAQRQHCWTPRSSVRHLQVGLMWSEEDIYGMIQRKETEWGKGHVMSLRENKCKSHGPWFIFAGQNQTLPSSDIPKPHSPMSLSIHVPLKPHLLS